MAAARAKAEVAELRGGLVLEEGTNLKNGISEVAHRLAARSLKLSGLGQKYVAGGNKAEMWRKWLHRGSLAAAVLAAALVVVGVGIFAAPVALTAAGVTAVACGLWISATAAGAASIALESYARQYQKASEDQQQKATAVEAAQAHVISTGKALNALTQKLGSMVDMNIPDLANNVNQALRVEAMTQCEQAHAEVARLLAEVASLYEGWGSLMSEAYGSFLEATRLQV